MRVISGYQLHRRKKYVLRKQNQASLTKKWGMVAGAVLIIASGLYLVSGGDDNKKAEVKLEKKDASTKKTQKITLAEKEIIKKLAAARKKNKIKGNSKKILEAGIEQSAPDLRGYRLIKYRIRKGDNLYSIAKLFATKVKLIKSANPGTSPRSLRVGQAIRIPVDRSIQYRVKRGETLSRIAKRFGVSVNELKMNNRLARAEDLRSNMNLVIF